jgi:hypothetical protein
MAGLVLSGNHTYGNVLSCSEVILHNSISYIFGMLEDLNIWQSDLPPTDQLQEDEETKDG